jgi:signal transduction histidine kinase
MKQSPRVTMFHECRRIIEAHGGRIGLESSPGEGSAFWFEVPITDSVGR